MSSLELDHVLIPVDDLDAAARELAATHGLASVEGGRHAAWGTANRIVPLGDAYLELVAVVDPAVAADTTFGRLVADAAKGRPLGWVVRTQPLDDVASRLGLTPAAGSRTRPDGTVIRWRTAGMETALAEPPLPFFIEWGEGTEPPGRTPIVHPAGAVRLDHLVVAGDADRLRSWLDGVELPILVRPGRPGLDQVVLQGDRGRIVL